MLASRQSAKKSVKVQGFPSGCLLLHCVMVVLKKFTCNIYPVEVSSRVKITGCTWIIYSEHNKCLHRKCPIKMTKLTFIIYNEDHKYIYTVEVSIRNYKLSFLVMTVKMEEAEQFTESISYPHAYFDNCILVLVIHVRKCTCMHCTVMNEIAFMHVSSFKIFSGVSLEKQRVAFNFGGEAWHIFIF